VNLPDDVVTNLHVYWNSQEVPDDWSGVRMVASRAVALVAARGGTMPAEDLEHAAQVAGRHAGSECWWLRKSLRHIAALGAENATLRAKVAALEADAADAKTAGERMATGIEDLKRERDEARAELANVREQLRIATDVMAEQDAATVHMPPSDVTEAVTGLRALTQDHPEAEKYVQALCAAARPAPPGQGKLSCDCRTQNIACIHEAVRLLALKSPGQVAEDVEAVHRSLCSRHDGSCAWKPDAHSALSRLAALAQRTQEAEDKAVELHECFRNALAGMERTEAQLGAIRERAEDEMGTIRVGDAAHGDIRDSYAAVARWVVDGDAPHKSVAAMVEQGGTARGRCFRGTCNHPDAATPGHAERVAERSKAFSEAASLDAGALDPMHPNGKCTCAGEGSCAWCDVSARDDGFADGFDKGAEAMRAACVENVTLELEARGLDDLVGVVKARLTGVGL
jgi:hypothetical protein